MHYWKHQEWSKRDPDGVPATVWSLAFPEVRKYWLSLLEEALAYGIDGLQVHLNRGFPFALYKQPTVDSFKEKNAENPEILIFTKSGGFGTGPNTLRSF